MSIIIRLQNLPWEANSLDIRRFFQGLSIPDGGVHIVGGEKGDAFIAFSSDEDARQAMARDGSKIKETPLKLFLSSRNEMQRVIELARSQSVATKATEPMKAAPPALAVINQGPPMHAGPPPRLASSGGPGMAVGNGRDMGGGVSRFSQPGNPNHQNGDSPTRRLGRDRSRSPIARKPEHYDGPHMSRFEPRPPMNAGAPPMGGIVQVNSYGENGPPPARGQFDGFGGPAAPPNQPWNQRPPMAPITGASREPNGMLPRMPLNNANDNNRMQPNNMFTGNRLPPNAMNTGNLRIEIRGLPFDIMTRDIQEFLRKVNLYLPEESINILQNDHGFKTGVAVVRLAGENEFEAALSANGMLFRERRVEVMPLLENVPLANQGQPVIPSMQQQQHHLRQPPPVALPPPVLLPSSIAPSQESLLPLQDFVIYMKGIPFNSCSPGDVSSFFRALKLRDVVFETDARTGKPAGNAYVEFTTKEDYESALAQHMKHMGRRYIEVFPTTRDDMAEARIKLGLAGDSGPPVPVPPAKRTFCITMTGLPESITNRDLTGYFQEVNSVPFAIHILLKPDGGSSGDAFVEFLDPAHHRRALERDGSFIANHRISVKNVDYDLMASIVRKPAPPPQMPLNPVGGGNQFGNSRPPSHHHHDNGRGDSRGRDTRFDDRRRHDRRSPPMRGGAGPRGGMAPPVNGGGGGGNGGANAGRPFEDGRCVVIASNIPYKASNSDLYEFFRDFAVVSNGIERRVNERGQTAPEARIAFAGPEEAAMAVRSMHKKTLLGRPLFLRHAV
ncbi:RNA-binding protein 12 [Halotydeus destructor]|nr:RNA-binding protein 12 [Halotydeus destructor]